MIPSGLTGTGGADVDISWIVAGTAGNPFEVGELYTSIPYSECQITNMQRFKDVLLAMKWPTGNKDCSLKQVFACVMVVCICI